MPHTHAHQLTRSAFLFTLAIFPPSMAAAIDIDPSIVPSSQAERDAHQKTSSRLKQTEAEKRRVEREKQQLLDEKARAEAENRRIAEENRRLREELARAGQSVSTVTATPPNNFSTNILSSSVVSTVLSINSDGIKVIKKAKAKKAKKAKSEPEMVAIANTNYEIGKYEVTVAQYLACVQDGGCAEPEWRESGSKYNIQTGSDEEYKILGDALTGGSFPIVGVSWDNAQQYVKWLNQKTSKSYRLPSESEWQTACFSGNQTEYCGGTDANTVAWHIDNSDQKPHPVGEKQANAYGLYDMSGNVFEWTQNCYDSGCDRHVLRGGSWLTSARNLSAVKRSVSDQSKGRTFGFRLARTLP